MWLSAMFTNHGVLGLNARNLTYVGPFNPKKATAFADNKVKTKAFLSARGIPAAKIFARIERRDQLYSFDYKQLPDECVLKPNYGFGGEGILVLKGRKNGKFMRNGKVPMSNDELTEHIEDILDGKFSLGGRRDTAFFEQVLESHDCFAPFRPVGLPDIRIIVFNLVPIMAMLRIPTGVSDGKANLHLGGMGIGIDIAKGVTTHAAQYHDIITELPHGGSPSGHAIPFWDDILLACSRIQHITNIGYLAVDVTIDKTIGPAVLEVNARAGLNVQIANLAPLGKRLERVKGLSVSSPEKGVRIGQDLFGEKLTTTKVEEQSKPVLGLRETITIVGSGVHKDEISSIAPEHERTLFTQDLLDELVKEGAAEVDTDDDSLYKVKFSLADAKIQTVVGSTDAFEDSYRVRIGRRDLSGFFIDPSKKTEEVATSVHVKTDLRAIDKLLAQADKEILLLKYVKPTNLEQEREHIEADPYYNPIFTYAEVDADLEDLSEKLQDSIQDQSPLGTLLEKKRKELLNRIELLQARGDAQRFTKASIALYGQPTKALLSQAKQMLSKREACLIDETQEVLNAEKAAEVFEEVLKKYSLHNWQVTIRPRLVADCTVGGKKIYVREGAEFIRDRIDALVKHEIETHVLTAENGDHQPYALFRRGCAGYLDTQEGLATYNQNRIYGEQHNDRYNAPNNLLGIHYGLTHSYAEARAYFEEELGYSPENAIKRALSLKRGLSNTQEPGAFTKGIVYFRGLRAIEKFVKKGGDIRQLYIGKIAVEDLETVLQIEDLQEPLLLPDFLRES